MMFPTLTLIQNSLLSTNIFPEQTIFSLIIITERTKSISSDKFRISTEQPRLSHETTLAIITTNKLY